MIFHQLSVSPAKPMSWDGRLYHVYSIWTPRAWLQVTTTFSGCWGYTIYSSQIMLAPKRWKHHTSLIPSCLSTFPTLSVMHYLLASTNDDTFSSSSLLDLRKTSLVNSIPTCANIFWLCSWSILSLASFVAFTWPPSKTSTRESCPESHPLEWAIVFTVPLANSGHDFFWFESLFYQQKWQAVWSRVVYVNIMANTRFAKLNIIQHMLTADSIALSFLLMSLLCLPLYKGGDHLWISISTALRLSASESIQSLRHARCRVLSKQPKLLSSKIFCFVDSCSLLQL